MYISALLFLLFLAFSATSLAIPHNTNGFERALDYSLDVIKGPNGPPSPTADDGFNSALDYSLKSINKPSTPLTPSTSPIKAEGVSTTPQMSLPAQATLVNATVSCRGGEFQNSDTDIQQIVCRDYYKCAGGRETETVEQDGVVLFGTTCLECEAGQAGNKVSGCTFTEVIL